MSGFSFEYEMVEPRREHAGTTPIIFLLHDSGSNPAEILERVYPYIDPLLRIISIRGPIACGDGYSWFDLDDGGDFSFDNAILMLREINIFMFKVGMKYSPVLSYKYVYGEGDGATIALADHLGVGRAKAQNGLGMIGVGAAAKYIAIGARLPATFKCPIDQMLVNQHMLFLGQGVKSDLKSIQNSREMVSWLQESGLKPDYQEFDMSDRPSDECVAAAMNWIGHIGPAFRS